MKTDDEARMEQALASFSSARKIERQMDAEFLAFFPDSDPAFLQRPTRSAYSTQTAKPVEVPFTIAKKC